MHFSRSGEYPKWLESLRIKTIELFEKYSLPRWMVFVLDNLAVSLVFFFAYLLRYNFVYAGIKFNLVINHALLTVGTYALFSFLFRSYSGIIRHTTLTDISQVFVVTTISSATLLLFTFCGRILSWSENLMIPISIILIHYVSITVLLCFVRVFIKIIFCFAISSVKNKKNVIIYGAGEMGFIVKRVILSDPQGGFNVVGFLDKNKHLQGKKINGLPVYSPKILSTGFLVKNNIKTLVLAVTGISSKEKSEIIHSAIGFDLEILKTPAINEWLNGRFRLQQLQKVNLEDLLGRDPIKLNMNLIRKGLNNKVILVTGAAGSIGSEIVRQLARFNIRKVILVDQSETPLFNLENEIRKRFIYLNYNVMLADITIVENMEWIFQKFHPEIVFHAAAYKHVPILEENPYAAFRINVGGTKLLTELSLKYGVEKFVMISTDKAVNPSSIMGAAKRACEMIVQSKAQQKSINTQFVITRFGNVLGSNGSVIPLFKTQIEEGGPVTVTHNEITRYFMTIPEACELVLEAGFMGKGGEIFEFDMGTPIKIADLANQMIRLAGLIPGKDIQVVYTGLRPGEKLHEELLSNRETTLPTYHSKIKIAQVEKGDYTSLVSKIDELIKNLYNLSQQEVVKLFEEIVPEYKYYRENSDDQSINEELVKVESL